MRTKKYVYDPSWRGVIERTSNPSIINDRLIWYQARSTQQITRDVKYKPLFKISVSGLANGF